MLNSRLRLTAVAYTVADNLHPSNINTDIIYLENESENPGFAVRVNLPH